ncbi:hypothetical protein HNR44_003242 [Geomicrobium halophilum]|uniref:Aminoglycoside phosphotransferase domain-containing protein n=1 Tax=Geomicrobium halophilum TaxID=549000 RepID=A0A841Q2R7_9BACL|nr:hypothetical protein [Geomicrobium halophilum]
MLLKFIVLSKDQNRLLLDQNQGRYAWPSVHCETTHVAVTSHIYDFFLAKYHLKVNVLRCFLQDGNLRIYEVEALDDDHRRFWVDASLVMELVDSGERKEFAEWLTKVSDRAIPWFQPGWRQEMEMWVREQIPSRIITFEQVRSWERSALFKIHTKQENYYFKAVPEVFSHEPSVQNFIAELYPSYVPEVIVQDIEKNSYMMRELEGGLLGESDQRIHWKRALQQMVTIQRQSIYDNRELQKLACPVRPMKEVLTNHLPIALDELVTNFRIPREHYTSLKESIPSMMAHVHALEHSNLPLALDHGDFFGGNIIVQDGQPLIYDWSDSSLTHPFLSVIVFLDEVKELFSEDFRNQLLGVYLDNWRAFDTYPRLQKEFHLVHVLAPLFYLTVHQRYIFPAFKDNIEHQQIIDHYVDQWLANI